MNEKPEVTYEKPEVTDYGTLVELTAGGSAPLCDAPCGVPTNDFSAP
jgi:hypothetical protein